MNANRTLGRIVATNNMSKELDEDVLKIYTSHPDIDLDEIMDRLKFYSY